MWINGAIFEVDVATQVRVAVRVEQKITNSKSPKGGCGEIEAINSGIYIL
jgi:hypothetical protein